LEELLAVLGGDRQGLDGDAEGGAGVGPADVVVAEYGQGGADVGDAEAVLFHGGDGAGAERLGQVLHVHVAGADDRVEDAHGLGKVADAFDAGGLGGAEGVGDVDQVGVADGGAFGGGLEQGEG